MKDDIGSLLKRFSVFTIGPLVSAFIGFILVPVTTWFISPEEFGKASLYILVVSLTGIVSMLGLDNAFVREFHKAKNKSHLLLNSFFIPLIISLLLAIITLINYKSFSIILFQEINLTSMLFIALGIIIQVVNRFNLLLVRSLENGRLYSGNLILEKTLNLIILILLFYYFEKSFTAVIIAQVLGQFGSTIMMIIACKKYWFYKIKIDKKLLIKLFKFGLPMAPSLMMIYLLTSVDKIFLRAYSDFSELGIYTAAFKIVGVVAIFKASFATFWSPTAYRWYEEKVPNAKFSRVSSLIASISIIIFGVLVLTRDLLVVVIGEDYASASLVIPFLLIVPITELMDQTGSKGIVFLRKTIYNLISSFIAVFINIVLNFFLIPSYGAIGAAIATGVSFLVLFWVRVLISRSLWYKFSLKPFIYSSMIMIIMSISILTKQNLYTELIIFIVSIFLFRKDFIYLYNKLSDLFFKKDNN